jgi:hypothetical protein
MSELSVGQLKGLTVNNNVIDIPSGHTVYAPGHIIQVVQTVKTNAFATSAGAKWADIPGMAATITPKFSTSKILVTVDLKMAGTQDNSVVRSKLLRGSTDIYVGDASGTRPQAMSQFYISSGGAPYYMAQGGGTYLDSPSTTAPITYKVQIGGDSNSTTVYVNRTNGDRDYGYGDSRGASSITLMEIAA